MREAAATVRLSAFLARALRRMPDEVARSFSPAQLRAIEHVFGMRYSAEHAIDLRHRFRCGRLAFYIVLLAGREGRRG
jgi:hypothetical protein